jgi:hypothetical protein
MTLPTFRTDFERLSPEMIVAAARRKMGWGMRGGFVYGVVEDAEGQPLALLRPELIMNWPDAATLAEMREWWPMLCILPWAEGLDVTAVARFYADDLLEYEDLPGILLVDADGQTITILERKPLLEALDALKSPLEAIQRGGEVKSPRPAEAKPVIEPDCLMVTRYGRLQFPGQAALGQPVRLRVMINREALSGVAGQVELGLTARQWPLKVVATLVGLSPEDFLLDGPPNGVIDVPAQADSQPLDFTLLPQSLGRKIVHVRFEQDNAYLGTAFIHTEIVEEAPAEPEPADVHHTPVLNATGLPPDVTIYIERARESSLSYNLSVRLSGDDPEAAPREIDEIVFPRSPEAYMQAIYDDLDAMTKQGLSPEEFDDEVRRIGFSLYDELFHGDTQPASGWGFRTFYYRVMARLPQTATVQVVSDEPYVPWELVMPFRQKSDGRWESETMPLCERFVFSRWLSGPGPATRLALNHVALVAPPSNLAYVAHEVRVIKGIPDVQVEVIETKPALDVFLKSQQTDSLHFACHGRFNTDIPGRSAVQLGNRFLRPADITAERRNFGRNQPLVFLNACDSGRLGLGLTGLDGWAVAFRNANVGSFIGSIWSTTDELACTFAEVFYARLRGGDTIGEAVRQARFAVMRTGNATHLSYTLYANPRARIA